MILVDTNVWSETLRPEPNGTVLAWMERHHRSLWLAAVTVHELRFGVALLPPGRRRDILQSRIDGMLEHLSPRVLPHDAAAARAHADLRLHAQQRGRTLTPEDGQILGIASSVGAAVATRNLRDFVDLGVRVIDPWGAESVSS